MKKWGGQLDIRRSPNLKIVGGRVPPIPLRIDAPAYISTHSLTQKNTRRKNVTWYNQHFSAKVATDIGQKIQNEGCNSCKKNK